MSTGMRKGLPFLFAASLLAGCNDNGTVGPSSVPPGNGDLAVAAAGDMAGQPSTGGGNDMALPPAPDDQRDGGPPGSLGDGGVFTPPPGDMGPIDLGPPITSGNVTVYGKGGDFKDVSTDQGGGIWAVSSSTVFYFKGSTVHTYDQGAGLARGQKTWTDTYWFGSPSAPSTQNVSFTTVAGGMSGQAFVGNIGYTGDRLDVDPSTGAVIGVVGMQVTCTQHPCDTPEHAAEEKAQEVREVSSWRALVDLNGPINGRAYFGGFHGVSALSDMTQPLSTRLCGDNCTIYEEHLHPFGSDALGRDVRALAVTPMGDLWVGDADSIWFVPQRSAGADSDFFQNPAIPGQSASYLDVFPDVNGQKVADMVFGIAVDSGGGVWVASYGNGLAYLTPGTYAPTYWSTANGLPSNYLTGVAVDASGTVWVGTQSNGVARYTPSANKWDLLTTSSGLPSNDIRSVRVDQYGDGKSVLLATDSGAAVWHP